MVCHSRAANFVLGLSTEQLNRTHDYPRGTLNQLTMLERLGLLRVDWQTEAAQRAKGEMTAAGLSGDALESAIARHTDSRGQRACTPSMLLAHAPSGSEQLVDPGDENAPLEKRARSYLHANCAQCHQPAGGGNAQIDLRYFAPQKDFNAIDVAPMHDTYGIAGAKLIAPGDPERSLLLMRMSRRGRGQMPQLATTRIDQAGAAVIRRWIEQLKNDKRP
jgi:mono/diheme cytochrome c family protein